VKKVKMHNRAKSVDTGTCCPTESWGETRKISLLRAGAHAVSVSCCPIEIGEVEKTESIPDNPAYEGEQARKAVRPLAFESEKAQQDVEQEGGPELPADGMLGITEEVADFEGLFYLLEEGLDPPAAAVQVADTGRSPVQIIGQKNHDSFLSVDFDEGLNAPQSLRILSAGLGTDQGNIIIAEDLSGALTEAFATDMVTQIILGPCDPEDASLVQVEKTVKMDVGLVENGDLPVLKPGTKGQSACAVVMGSLFNDGECGKETLQVQPQMHLRSGFAPPVLGPVHTVGNQGNGRGIHSMDRPLEAAGQSVVAASGPKARRKFLQMAKDLPEKLLHHVAVAMLVRMGKRVASGRYRAPDRSQLAGMVAQGIAHIVESDRMGKLGEKKAHNVTPGREGPGLLVDPVFAGEFFRLVRRDKFTKLMQCAAVVLGRRYVFHTLDSLVGIQRRPPFLTGLIKGLQLHPVG